jgi:MinD-like ATPase involved in chromosome partitioning or flagellar assembly
VTPERNENTPDELENGVLTTGSVDTAGIGLVGGATAQVDVDLPDLSDDDDLLGDDDVILDTPPAGTDIRGAIDAEIVDDATPAGGLPATRREAFHVSDDAKHAVERVHPRAADVPLQSRRLGEFEAGRETSDLLTADRLLDPAHVVRPEPEGGWQHFVYSLTGHRVNLGDSKSARARKDLDRRIAAPLGGGAKFVPILSRKGGVGKTTVSTLLGMALADARDDRVIAIDANPDRGTLADRIGRTSGKTVRDLVRVRGDVVGFNDLSSIVARDETRLDVLASDADPRVSEAFNDRDYHDVAAVAAHYYSIVLTDTGTGIVHSVMEATLELADALVIVAGLSVDEARLASETLTWLETNGFEEQVRNAVVVLNTARPGTPLVRASELEAHFRTRVRSVVRMPYDPHLAAGSAVSFRDLQPATRQAARELAATVVEGLRILAAA